MNKCGKLLSAALAVAVAGGVLAGSKFNGNGFVVVRINADGSGSASGYFGMIYNGPNVREYIGCQRRSGGWMSCQANSEAGQRIGCVTNSTFLAQSVATLSPDARLYFQVNSSGDCTSITVVHSSEYEDKK